MKHIKYDDIREMLIFKIEEEIENFDKDIEKVKEIIQNTVKVIYHTTFKQGDSFGEKAFIKLQPRGGTCISATETFCVAVHKTIYIKTVKKCHNELIKKRMKFLKQIHFMKNWSSKEI